VKEVTVFSLTLDSSLAVSVLAVNICTHHQMLQDKPTILFTIKALHACIHKKEYSAIYIFKMSSYPYETTLV
jgi:hypothetical protein